MDGEEQLHTHPPVSWDQPRRLANPLLTIRFDTDFPFSAFLYIQNSAHDALYPLFAREGLAKS